MCYQNSSVATTPLFIFSFVFCVSKFPNLFWSLIKCFTNLFGMGEMIGSKELAFVTIIMIVGSVWLTLIISPKNKKWYGSKLLLDDKFESFLKTNELSEMDRQWRWHAVEIIMLPRAFKKILNGLHSTCTLIADSLRTWYIYHERACQEIYNTNFFDMVNQCLWFFIIEDIRSRTKHYIYFEDGCEKGILTIFLIRHFWVVNFLKNWFWTLIFPVKIEGNLIFLLWNEFLVHGLKILILRILIFFITLLLVCFMLIKSPKFTYSLSSETCLSNRDTE